MGFKEKNKRLGLGLNVNIWVAHGVAFVLLVMKHIIFRSRLCMMNIHAQDNLGISYAIKNGW